MMGGRPRNPLAAAKATGADVKNPQRYRGRKEPKVDAIGPAPRHLPPEVKAEWDGLVSEIPWLAKSDRTIVESAARLRALQVAGELPASLYAELRQTLNALGATPAARSKVAAPDDDPTDDPAAEFLN
jgi:phage terminase small subunit